MPKVSAARFASALKALPKPGGKQIKFLAAHYKAPRRALTAKQLAQKAGYKSYRGIYLCYGRLAEQIGPLVGQHGNNIILLVDYVASKSDSSKGWLLVMRPEFARGLKQAGWV